MHTCHNDFNWWQLVIDKFNRSLWWIADWYYSLVIHDINERYCKKLPTSEYSILKKYHIKTVHKKRYFYIKYEIIIRANDSVSPGDYFHSLIQLTQVFFEHFFLVQISFSDTNNSHLLLPFILICVICELSCVLTIS